MEMINQILSGVLVPLALVAFGLLFSVKLHGEPLRHSGQTLGRIFAEKGKGGRSQLGAVALALAGTLGVGNIVGVAGAIAAGGPGAVFWMWISALLAMVLKYGEVLLAVKHRRVRRGRRFGGAMYYMRDAFDSRGRAVLAGVFPTVFTVLCIINGFTMGGIIQADSASEAIAQALGVPKYLSAAAISIFALTVLLGGAEKIFSFCLKLVPLAAGVYMLMSFSVIIKSADGLGETFGDIVRDALTLRSAVSGVGGFVISKSLRYGTIRGLFSNEAGCGTSPMAHATADTDSPVKQGFLGVTEVFLDTVVFCTLTAFAVLLNREEALGAGEAPMLIVMRAFRADLGGIADVLVSGSVLLFALATVICWGYYGIECMRFLTGSEKYRGAYCVLYAAVIFVGSVFFSETAWEVSDLVIGLMTLMNLSTMYLLRNEIVEETKKYYKKEK